MKIRVVFNKSFVFLFLFVLFLIIGGMFVYSLTPGIAPNPGHTLDNVAPPSPCATGEFLSWTGSAWDCVAGGSLSVTEEFSCTNLGTFAANFVDCPVNAITTWPNTATIFKVCFLVSSYHSGEVASNNDCSVSGTVGGTWTLSTVKRQNSGVFRCTVRCIL